MKFGFKMSKVYIYSKNWFYVTIQIPALIKSEILKVTLKFAVKVRCALVLLIKIFKIVIF